jgi:hypothetical protein
VTPLIDVTGYLLAVVAFSVGFLSTRLHGHADRLREFAQRASWRLEGRLAEGTYDERAEVPAVIQVQRNSRDITTALTLWTNRVLLIGPTVLAVVVLVFDIEREADPDDAVAVFALLWIGLLLITIVGEMDARRTVSSLNRTVRQTTVGRLEELFELLRNGDWGLARASIGGLHRDLPPWQALDELEALCLYQEGHHEEAFGLVRASSAHHPPSTLGVYVLCETALTLGRYDAARNETAKFVNEPNRRVDLVIGQRLNAQMAFLNAEPEAIFGETSEVGDVDDNRSIARRVPNELISLIDADAGPANSTVDEFADLTLFQNLRALDALHAWWHRPPRSPEPPPAPDDWPIVQLVRFLTAEDDAVVARLLADYRAGTSIDRTAGLVESLALVLLAIHRSQEMVSLVEEALRGGVTNVRLQWCLFVAYRRLGWGDIATTALQRVEVLAPREIFVEMSRRLDTQGSLNAEDGAGRARSVIFHGDELADLAWAVLRADVEQESTGFAVEPSDTWRAGVVTGLVARAAATDTLPQRSR